MLNPNAPSFYVRPFARAFDIPVFFPPTHHHVSGFPSCLPAPILLPSVDLFFDKCPLPPPPPPPPPPFNVDSKRTYPIDKVILPPSVSTSDTVTKTERPPLRKTFFSVSGPRSSLSRRTKVVKVWMAKSSGRFLSPSAFNPSEFDDGDRTTVMIKNIPNRLSREKLIGILDQHCMEENEKEKEKLPSEPVLSEYDFVYLPMDFRNQCNLGYGFVNFTTHRGAVRFYNTYVNHRWEIYESKKVCEVSSARIQGKAALVERFKKTCFNCHSDDYLPVQFTPPRNGFTSLPDPVLVGSRRPSLTSPILG